MQFSFNIYSSLLLIFFVHIMVYAFMLWRRGYKQDSLSDQLLGWFLFFAALFVVPWMTGFAGWYVQGTVYREILFYTPFVHGLFMGPLLYFYVRSITNFHFRFSKKDLLHFVPGVVYLLWSLIVVVTDKLIVKKYYLMDGYSDPDFDGWYQWLQNISILFYLVLSIRFYRQYKQYVMYEFSFVDVANLNWLRNFLIAFAIITMLPLLEELLSFFPFFQNMDYRGSWYSFFVFAVVVYYVAINGFNAVVVPLRKLLFEPELLLQYKSPALLTAATTTEAEFEIVESKINNIELDNWKEKISTLMQSQHLYENAELTLSQLAKQLSTNPSLLSRIINTGFGINFNDFVNEYRINAMLEKLKQGEQKNQTLLGIAFDCGFNSKATFNRAFKKQTGLSPKEWMEKNL
ncbi:AraC family transcriptional regulator [Lacibacter sp. MH-610]|uniref:helix-turn-helix domain-containing protein n=1 Tax=Lacibacter sp. MH-610 TaxID=3020883 RepID=UPI0038911EDE